MRRREFVTLVGGAAAWPIAAHAQQLDRVRRVGVLLPATSDEFFLAFPRWLAHDCLHLRMMVACMVGAAARQFGDIHRNPPRLVFSE
jgi:hypothetical protein